MLEYRTAVQYELIKVKCLKSKVECRRSFCDGCGRQLKWYENIPVFSWVVQGGRSRCCRKNLPVSYPIVELLVGILFLLQFSIFKSQFLLNSFNLQYLLVLLFELLIIVFLVFSTVFDWKYMILPDFSTAILIICSVIILILNSLISGSWVAAESQVLSAVGAGGFLYFLFWITRGRGMGFGDVKLAVFMGLFLDFPKIILAFYAAFIVGALTGGMMMILGRAKKESQISFGPFLVLGVLIAWWSGDFVINLIKRWWLN